MSKNRLQDNNRKHNTDESIGLFAKLSQQPCGFLSTIIYLDFSLKLGADSPKGYTFVTGRGFTVFHHTQLFYNEERAPEAVLLL